MFTLMLAALLSEPPKVTKPTYFNTPEADAIVSKMQIYPADNPWNEDISKRPLRKNSTAIIATIGPEKRFAYNLDMAYILVPADQKRVDVKITQYPDESDKGPYPVPNEAPIENWPLNGRKLADDQAKVEEADRHVIVVDPFRNKLYEFWIGNRTDANGWQAACAATFDLNSNKLRPDGWTSSDAAGLPIFPAIVRYDECAAGLVKHAMRFTVRRTQRAYVYPATHFASKLKDADLPRMGERFRLRADFDVSGYPAHAQAILKGLKTYGMFVADNGGDWRLSVAPDARIQGLDSLRKVKGSDFEVIEPTGPNDGPRAKR